MGSKLQIRQNSLNKVWDDTNLQYHYIMKVNGRHIEYIMELQNLSVLVIHLM